jgi:hypothetical protein
MKYVCERDGTVVIRASSFYQILGMYTKSFEDIKVLQKYRIAFLPGLSLFL